MPRIKGKMLAHVVIFMTFVMEMGTSTQNQEGSGSGSVVDINGLSLLQICQLFNLTGDLCTCPSADPLMSQICRIEDSRKGKNIRLICDTRFSFQRHETIVVPLAILGMIGNFLVLLVTKQQWAKSSNSQKLIGALAFSDILSLIANFVIDIDGLLTCEWALGNFMCKFLRSGIIVTGSMALGFILIISIDRYYGIVHPFDLYITKKKIWIMITINIVLSIAIALPLFFILNVRSRSCIEVWSDQSHSLIYSWVSFFFAFLLPLLAISCFYVRMVGKLKTFQSRIEQNLSERQKHQRHRENRRMNLILACLITVFFILVLPNKVYWVLKDHGIWRNMTGKHYVIIKYVGFSAYVLHSCINPLIYSVVDKRFRSNLLAIFCRCKKANQSNHRTPPANNAAVNVAIV